MAVVPLPSDRLAAGEVAPRPERSRVWRKLAGNPAALAGALVLLVVATAAAAAPWIAPHDPARQSLI
ncbi:MAG: ABC transporter permease, partial [Candidatus Rokubacteria bacterium]|nr:ABC transporter permease [Candidatus Rokubacteria bacterium]